MSEQPEPPVNEIRNVDVARAARYALACQEHDGPAMTMVLHEVIADGYDIARLTTALASQSAMLAVRLSEIISSSTFRAEALPPLSQAIVKTVEAYSGAEGAVLMELIAASQRE